MQVEDRSLLKKICQELAHLDARFFHKNAAHNFQTKRRNFNVYDYSDNSPTKDYFGPEISELQGKNNTYIYS